MKNYFGFLMEGGLIIGGDLNITMNSRDAWGDDARLDPLSNYFLNMFTFVGLFDVSPCPIIPTWWNGRLGTTGISKRLDRFLINEGLLGSLGR
jgi:hypothetical protein